MKYRVSYETTEAPTDLPDGATVEWDGYSEPPLDVVETRDKDGDHWFRCANGGWSAYSAASRGDLWDYPYGGFPAKYGPHTIVRRQ